LARSGLLKAHLSKSRAFVAIYQSFLAERVPYQWQKQRNLNHLAGIIHGSLGIAKTDC